MRHAKWITIAAVFCVFVAYCPLAICAEQDKKTSPDTQSPQPMIIKSESLVVDDSTKLVTFEGNVSAQRQDFTIDCDKMLVYYKNSAENRPTGNTLGSKITKIVAEGHVRIRRKVAGEALARHAEYYEGEDKVVLTGDPMVKQGSDFVQGDRIIIYLKQGKSIVQGSSQKKVKAVIYPKKEAK